MLFLLWRQFNLRPGMDVKIISQGLHSVVSRGVN